MAFQDTKPNVAKITIELTDRTIELTVREARDLHKALENLFSDGNPKKELEQGPLSPGVPWQPIYPPNNPYPGAPVPSTPWPDYPSYPYTTCGGLHR
jgi:hypothetical protein